ncbi:MAG: ComF family protein [Kiritimatiellia bacterium]
MSPVTLQLRTWLRAAADLVYPRRCACCGVDCSSEPGHLCWDCLHTVAVIQPPFCDCCGMPVAGRVDHRFVCHQCGERKPKFDRARAAARFDGPVREAVHAFKYNSAFWLEKDLVDLLESGLRVLHAGEAVDLVVPVPLFRARFRERGYNQSELLARGLARRAGLRCDARLLRRVRDTGSQTKLTASGRLSNVRQAFEVRRSRAVAGRVVLVVDDVMTTGATLSECARVLRGAGAKRVLALAVARG